MMCDLMLPLRGHTMWGPLLLLLIMGVSEVNSGHSLQYYYTAVSVPETGLREFVSAGYVDGIEITRYSSDVGRAVPAAPWMEKVKDPELWERETKNYEVQEKYIKLFLNMEMKRLNQTNGYRIVQVMHGCELRDDGSTRGYARLGYGGKDYLELDSLHSNVTWLTNESQRIAETLNSQEGAAVEQLQVLLQTGCIDQLTKCVGYSKDVLDRRVRPEVKVSDQTVNGVTKLHCQVYGFYPRDVDVKWQKNGIDVSSYEAKHVLPNSDGTYQIRFTVEVPAEDRESYSCLVDHAGLDRSLNETTKTNGWSLSVKIGVGFGGAGGFFIPLIALACVCK